MIENGDLTNEFSTADVVLEKRNKLTRYATGSEDFDDLLNGGFETQAITELGGNLDLANHKFVIRYVLPQQTYRK